MAKIEVILHGVPGGSEHDTDNYPVILAFSEDKDFAEALWIIPSFPGEIPGTVLSEIRVREGELQVVVDGPEGFKAGPYDTNWVRSFYPRGWDCSFLITDAATMSLTGVSVRARGGELSLGEVALGKKPEPPAAETPAPADEAQD